MGSIARKEKSKWSPNWITDRLVGAENSMRAWVAHAVGRVAILRFGLCLFFLVVGAWLAVTWPEQDGVLDRQFFASLGFGGKLIYFFVGAAWIFLFLGSLRQVLPAKFWPTQMTFIASAMAGLVVCHQSSVSLMDCFFEIILIVGPFLVVPLTLRIPLFFRSFGATLFILFVYLTAQYWVSESFESFGPVDRGLALFAIALLPALICSGIAKRAPLTATTMVVISLIGLISASGIMTAAIYFELVEFALLVLTPARYWMIGIFYLLSYLTILRTSRASEIYRGLLFPTHWAVQAPYSLNDLRNDEGQFSNYVTGLFQLLNCALLIAAVYFLDRTYSPLTLHFPWHGLGIYLHFFFLSWLTFLIPVAGASLLGYRVPEPFIHPLLAANPADRWRRWNTYYYEWFRLITFVPIFRRTNSLFVAIMLTFTVTWMIHMNLNFINMAEMGTSKLTFIATKLLFFLSHGLAVYIGLKFPALFPDGNRKRGWLGVVFVLVIMVLIHHLAAVPLGKASSQQILNLVN